MAFLILYIPNNLIKQYMLHIEEKADEARHP
jgi:hypothetical protein